MNRGIHAIAGRIGFLAIPVFWTVTTISELFGSQETITALKA